MNSPSLTGREKWLSRARQVIAIEAEEIERLGENLDEGFVKSVEMILEATGGNGKLVTAGIGKSRQVAAKIAATLTSTGTPALCLSTADALHGDLGIIKPGDIVLMLSYSGETDELVNILWAVRKLGNKIIGMTGNETSTLGRYSDAVLKVKVTQEACPLGLAPTSSSTCMMVLGDALAMVLMEHRGFSRDDFAKFHPSGTLGRRLLLHAADMTRSLDLTVIAHESDLVLDILGRTAQKKAGAAIVVDDANCLCGFFSHGDFVRALSSRNLDLESAKIGDLMTRNPICVPHDAACADVIAKFQQHRIDELIVVDGNRSPVGLIDSQDLVRLKVL